MRIASGLVSRTQETTERRGRGGVTKEGKTAGWRERVWRGGGGGEREEGRGEENVRRGERVERRMGEEERRRGGEERRGERGVQWSRGEREERPVEVTALVCNDLCVPIVAGEWRSDY